MAVRREIENRSRGSSECACRPRERTRLGQAAPAATLAARCSLIYSSWLQGRQLDSHSGELALEYGDLTTATGSFLDAAWIAQRRGQGTVARNLVSRARRLAHSPLIDAQDRELLTWGASSRRNASSSPTRSSGAP